MQVSQSNNGKPRACHRQSRALIKQGFFAGAALIASATAAAAPPLTLNNVVAPIVSGSGPGKRALWANGGTVGATSVDVVAVMTTATLNHTFGTTNNRPSITSVGVDNVFIQWRLYRAGTYNVATDSGGVPVLADIQVQYNDLDGPNNERLYVPVCAGDIKWVRIDKTATTGRAFGTVAGHPETFSLIGDKSYNNEPESGLEAFYPDRSTFEMGRTANSGFFIRLDNPTYSAFDTLDYECADFDPPVVANDRKEGLPGTPTMVDILANDSLALLNDNPTNNNTRAASENARASVALVPPPGATSPITGSRGTIIGLTVPGEGVWSYDENTGQLTFTPEASFKGYATQIGYTVKNALGVASTQALVTVYYPAIGVTKSSTFNDSNGDGYGQVGETIGYVYRVTAYGAEALQSVSLTETGFTGAGVRPTPTLQSGDTNADGKLDLTETWVYTATYTLVAADIPTGVSNQATAQGRVASGTVVSDLSDSLNPGDGNGSAVPGPGPGNGDPTRTVPAAAPIAAANDSQPGVITTAGAANAFSVLPNDSFKGAAASLATVTLTQVATTNPGVTLNASTGQVSVASGTPAGSYTIDYKLCETASPNNCANAVATVVVSAVTAIQADDDSAPAVVSATGGANLINVFANDQLNNVALNPANVTVSILTPASNPGVTLDTTTGQLSVAAGTPVGTYNIQYRICENANPGNCDSAIATVVVQPNAIAATGDAVTGINGASGSANAVSAFANDRLNGAAFSPGAVTATVTSPATPVRPGAVVPSLDPSTGIVSVPAGTPAGNYTIGYRICEIGNPTNCASAIVSIGVIAAPISASNDSAGTVSSGSGGTNIVNVLGNDRINGTSPTTGNVVVTISSPASDPGVSLSASSGFVSVAPGTPAGSYAIGYTICEQLNPANCATATASVTVAASAIVANADAAGPISSAAGGSNIFDVLANDRLNGVPVTPSDINLTVVSPASNPGVTLNASTGQVSVAPGVPAGTYSIAYQICERANPANCASATLAVTVSNSALTAGNDSAGPVGGAVGVPNLLNAFANDTLNGSPFRPADVIATIVTPALPTRPGAPVPILDPTTGNVALPAGTPAGTYSISYQICERVNPANCQTATVGITVIATPIAAVADSPAPVRGTSATPSLINAFVNDSLGGSPVNASNIVGSVTSPATPSTPGAPVPALDPSTGVVSVPANTPAGTYTIAYRICEALNPTNCADSSVTIAVTPAAIFAANDSAGPVSGSAGGANLVDALANDSFNGGPVDLTRVVLSVTSRAGNPGVILDPATGQISVATGTAAGTYNVSYQLCERLNPTNCANAAVTVSVTAPSIAASPDAFGPVNGAVGGANLGSVLLNDQLGGAATTVANVLLTITTPATPARPGLPVPMVDPATGQVAVPAGTPAGSYTIGYQICDRTNPANCATANVTVMVAPPTIVAGDDTPPQLIAGTAVPSLTNVLTNDQIDGVTVRGSDVSLTIVTPSADGGIVVDPATGNVAVGASVAPGTYPITYRICEQLNPTNCAIGRLVVTVAQPTSRITGTVFDDTNTNRQVDGGETRRPDWLVEIVQNGTVVASTRTDASGNYIIANLPSGGGYSLLFRSPDNNVVYDRVDNLTLGASATLNRNQPIDPSGLIYNSVTRAPIAGATVSFLDASGAPLPAACFIDGSQQAQRTGATGEYRFNLIPGGAAQCPAAERDYRIAVTPPAGFASGSTVLLPQTGPFDPTGLVGPVLVSPAASPPTGSSATYYYTFRLQQGDPDVVNNHLPIDPFLSRTPLILIKTSDRRTANVGDLVPYEITVRSQENVQRAGVTVVDILPAGMRYVPGTASVDGVALEPQRDDRQLSWSGQIIPGNGSVRYNLTLIVGAGVTGGERTNIGVARNGSDGTDISNRGSAVVSIVPSAVFDCSELLGKVFEDRNRNGYQDPGEPGVPGVRLANVSGQLITTDVEGRYHIACAAVPNARIGSNYVLKLDPRTLPLDWIVTTDNPRSIRLTRGKFGELNFGVAPPPERSATPTSPAGKGE